MSKKNNRKTNPYLIAVLIAAILLLLSQLFPIPYALSPFHSPNPLPCANSISCAKDLSGTYDPARKNGEFMGQFIPVPTGMFDQKTPSSPVLGKTTIVDYKKIFVDLTTQKLYAYEGNRLVYGFTISSGKWNPTPVGKFYIWTKLLATRMEGGEKADNTYYNLPNVPYTMYFYNENVGKWNGYGIHGAYWPISFGQANTFGCVALQVKDAAKLYYWTNAEPSNPPTQVIIFGKAPSA